MRRAFLLLMSVIVLSLVAPAFTAAQAQSCTGPDCVQQQQGDGHQCERTKKDQVTS